MVWLENQFFFQKMFWNLGTKSRVYSSKTCFYPNKIQISVLDLFFVIKSDLKHFWK